MVIVEGFEDGDTGGWQWDIDNVPASEGGTLTAQTNTILSGSYSGKFTTNGDDNTSRFRYQLPTYKSPSYFKFLFQANQVGNNYDFTEIRLTKDGSSPICAIEFEGGGNIRVNDGGSTFSQGSWSANTTYTVEFDIDWSNNQYDCILDGSTIASDQSYNAGSMENFNEIGIEQDSQYSSATLTSYHDNFSADVGPDPHTNCTTLVNDDTVTVGWTNSSDFNGTKVYRSQSSGTTTSDYTLIKDMSTTDNDYGDFDLLDGEKYYYRVTAYNEYGESDPTNEVSAVTQLPEPSNLTVN